jgi:hypothetical protein
VTVRQAPRSRVIALARFWNCAETVLSGMRYPEGTTAGLLRSRLFQLNRIGQLSDLLNLDSDGITRL